MFALFVFLLFSSSFAYLHLHLLDRQFYEFLQVDWATFLTYSLNMECTYVLKARELPC